MDPSNESASARQPTRTCLQQLSMVTGCSLEGLPEAVYDRDEWRERESQGNPCYNP